MNRTAMFPLDDPLSRRAFLVRAAGSTVALAAGTVVAGRAVAQGRPDDALPVVVQVRSDRVVTQRGIHDDLLTDLVEIALRRVTGASTLTDAWRSVLDPAEVVALKFDPVGADELGANNAMLRAVVETMTRADLDRRRILAVGVSPAGCDAAGVGAPAHGWSDSEHDFKSGSDRLVSWLEQVDAIVNVPTLKTHNIFGLAGSLVNLSHSVIKHPGQFHGRDGSPYIGDIVALPVVRNRLRLNLVNALRVVFDGGPEAREDSIWDAGMILASRDPVAADAVGLEVVDELRVRLNLAKMGAAKTGSLPYLEAAADRGLGACRLHQISVRRYKL